MTKSNPTKRSSLETLLLTHRPTLLARVMSGSSLYGKSEETSDKDYVDVFLPHIDDVLSSPILIDSLISRRRWEGSEVSSGSLMAPPTLSIGGVDVRSISLGDLILSAMTGVPYAIETIYAEHYAFVEGDESSWLQVINMLTKENIINVQSVDKSLKYFLNVIDSLGHCHMNEDGTIKNFQFKSFSEIKLGKENVNNIAHSVRQLLVLFTIQVHGKLDFQQEGSALKEQMDVVYAFKRNPCIETLVPLIPIGLKTYWYLKGLSLTSYTYSQRRDILIPIMRKMYGI